MISARPVIYTFLKKRFTRAGSGAWAIHAAKDYPDAEVIAIDVSPLPKRWVLIRPRPMASADPEEWTILQSASEKPQVFANGRLSAFAV